MAERQEGMMSWTGDPIYRIPSACRDERNTYRVFHRDIPGRIVAEFYGDDAQAAAECFCRMFGEPSGAETCSRAAVATDAATPLPSASQRSDYDAAMGRLAVYFNNQLPVKVRHREAYPLSGDGVYPTRSWVDDARDVALHMLERRNIGCTSGVMRDDGQPTEPGYYWTLRVGTDHTPHGTPEVVELRRRGDGELLGDGFGDMALSEIGFAWQKVRQWES